MITHKVTNFTCVKQPLARTLEAIEEISKRWHTPFHIDEVDERGFHGFDDQPIVQAMVWEPEIAKGTTAIATNLADGWYSLAHCIAVFFSYETAHCRIREGGVCEFLYYFDGKERRHVRILKDGRWQFWEEGVPLEFENIDQYAAHPISKRLRREDVESYFAHLGWEIGSPQFCHSEKPAYKVTEQSGFTYAVLD